MNIFQREPVRAAGIIRAALLMAVSFGFGMSGEQVATIMVLVEAILVPAVRDQVTPFQTPKEE